ncbi:complement factor I-like [Centroberyx gerrardi]
MRSAGVSLLFMFLLISNCNTDSGAPTPDEFLGSTECLEKKFTRASCDLVFCSPWERCINGRCSCKLPYQCPREGMAPVCGRDGRQYLSYCQAMALSCRTKKPFMSHFGENCGANESKFNSSIDQDTRVVKLFIPDQWSTGGGGEEVLVCSKLWDTAAANVACKEDKHRLCVTVRCQGYETSLAECVINEATRIGNRKVATATCYQATQEAAECEFRCVNSKCVFLNQTCDGVDDCGDRSDEMCCKRCRKDAFHCRTGVCVSREAVGDGMIDCLDGKDESPRYTKTRANRQHLESKLYCGIPNSTTVDDEEEEERGRSSRVKRVVGGIPAKPTQIQWQVAIEKNKNIICGGAYIGSCWVLTAAHCVSSNRNVYLVKFSLWRKHRAQDTTDIVLVRDIHIHPMYNDRSYENDIALLQLQKLPFRDECFVENPAISAVCVPWSLQLFQPNHTCSISGWGRTADARSSDVLLWANVSLIADCQRFYKDRFKPGMMCAGDLDGSVDSCQGDSGGPLVCEDDLGVSYLWGIVTWRESCGQPGFPGVYTQVAHYFEWIRYHTGWPAVTRFNS